MTANLAHPSQFGRYELRAVLGRGGMGVVYEAVLIGLVGFRKRVALKVLAAEESDLPAGQAALQREARVGALLSHPNVVSILDLGREHEQWYIAMELVDGHPVSQLLRARVVDPAAIVEIGLATCAGLAHIHDLRVEGLPAGLVHRDIKPQNLLVDRNGTLKIADFGIAALTSTRSDRGGSPAWMAPEQQTGVVNHQADLFSLGAVLYAMAARRTPFGTGTVALRESRRVEELLAEPTFLASVEHRVPGLGRIVSGCLRLRPEDRYASAHAVAADLRALRSSVGFTDLGRCVELAGPTLPGPTTPTPRANSGSRRPRGLGAGLMVGRVEQLRRVQDGFDTGTPCVTITGLGGSGKTRLALEVAELQTSGGRPAVWVSVTELDRDDPLAVLRATATALGVNLTLESPQRQLLDAVLAREPFLLVLDGVQGCVAATSKLIGWLSAEAPHASILVTSRVPLRLPKEDVVPLPPLSAPEGAALFEHVAGTTLTDTDRAALPGLVDLLDGLPLAIELAAARVPTLSVPQILDRMRDRFRLLVDHTRSGSSLRSTLETSLQMLPPWGVAALGQLTTFQGGFALEAAEAVLQLPDADAPWALDVVATLLDASLLIYDAPRQRFFMGHSVHQFVMETVDPAVRTSAELRHGEYFAQLGSDEVRSTVQRLGGVHLRRIEEELPNLQVAVDRAVLRGDRMVAVNAAFASSYVFGVRGPFAAGLSLLDRALAVPGTERVTRARLARCSLLLAAGERAAGLTELAQAEAEARSDGDQALADHCRALLVGETVAPREAIPELRRIALEQRSRGELTYEARALSVLAARLTAVGQDSLAREALERALSVLGAQGDSRGTGLQQLRLGRLDVMGGHLARALQRFQEAEQSFAAYGDDGHVATTLENRAVVYVEQGEFDRARSSFLEALASFRQSGARRSEGNVLANLCELSLLCGEPFAASAYLNQARSLIREGQTPELAAKVDEQQARLDWHLGYTERALQGWSTAVAAFERIGQERMRDAADAHRAVAATAIGGGAGAADRIRANDDHTAFWLWVELGHVLLDRGDTEGAREASTELHELIRARQRAPFALAVAKTLELRASRGGTEARGVLPELVPGAVQGPHHVRWCLTRAELSGNPEDLEATWAALDRAGYGAGSPIRTTVHRLEKRRRP